ncbi:MAG: hypothetical protein IJ861_10795 [Clostridia bacterium]|nr:hypothetical protein [Clostridia bacterium]
MAGYMIYWPEEYVQKIIAQNDLGPFKVIFGSHHRLMPPLRNIHIGDTVYPCTIMRETLCVLARMTIIKSEVAFEYLMRETGDYHRSLIPEYAAVEVIEQGSGGKNAVIYLTSDDDPISDISELPPNLRLYRQKPIPHHFHQEPIKCCAETAMSGTDGSSIKVRPMPKEILRSLVFGETESRLRPLRLEENGEPALSALYNRTRRMTPDTKTAFDLLFDGGE